MGEEVICGGVARAEARRPDVDVDFVRTRAQVLAHVAGERGRSVLGITLLTPLRGARLW